MEREILSPDVKLELLLTAQEDLEKFAQEVKQVKDLEYVVSGNEFNGRDYTQKLWYKALIMDNVCSLDVETLGPKLSTLEVSHTDQVKDLNDITNQVSQFMERYNGTVCSF